MKTKNLTSTLLAVLLTVGTAGYAQSEKTSERPYIGVLLDRSPLPDLLVKHLGLSPRQGIRIRNVNRSSPADKAGLQRDDLIIAFQGKKVTDVDKFVHAVRDAGVGTQVSLEIIHLGKRKTVNLKLAPFTGDVHWKYPTEPQIPQPWWPPEIFQLKPGDREWLEVQVPQAQEFFKALTREIRVYHHAHNGECYTVTIEGNPHQGDTSITVEVDDAEYTTTVKAIDKLPQKYRDTVKQDLQRARESSRKREHFNRRWKVFLPRLTVPELWKHPEDRYLPYYYLTPPFRPGDRLYNKIEKQLHELQKRLDKLEKRQQQILERLAQKSPPQKKTEQSQQAETLST